MGSDPGNAPSDAAEGESLGSKEPWSLRLYVAGRSGTSLKAIKNLEKLCEDHLKGQYDIEVIDLKERPDLASRDQILAIPTLVRELPLPMRKVIGDLSETKKVLIVLDIVDDETV